MFSVRFKVYYRCNVSTSISIKTCISILQCSSTSTPDSNLTDIRLTRAQNETLRNRTYSKTERQMGAVRGVRIQNAAIYRLVVAHQGIKNGKIPHPNMHKRQKASKRSWSAQACLGTMSAAPTSFKPSATFVA